MRDLTDGQYRWGERTRDVYREAERLLLGQARQARLRAADALHVALANIVGARVLVSFDARMRDVAETTTSLTVLP